MPLRSRLAPVFAPLAAAAALVAAGCGGDVTSLDPVAKAADTTGQSSFRFTFTGSDGTSAGSVTGSGAYDATGKRLRMTFSVPGPTGKPTSIDVVTDGSDGAVLYLRVPLLAAFLPQGKEWVELDLGKVAAASGIDLGQVVQAGRASPAELLRALLASKNATKVGRDRLAGVETTHYRTTIDATQLVPDRLGSSTRKQVEQLLRRTGGASLTVDVWVGDDGLVRRLRFEVPRIAPAGASFRGGTFTEELSGYGQPVDVAVPASADVFDASRRLGG